MDQTIEDGKKRRSVHRTQWAAQFAVASELCKQGYEVAFTMGNHPSVDLMVNSPSGCAFSIDVKGLYKKNFWAVSPKKVKEGLFYVLAYVPDDGSNRFFILSQAQVNEEIKADYAVARANAVKKGRSTERAGAFPGIPWKRAEKFEDKWKVLPA
ncbi:hypothetical protein ACE10Z_11955 [Bradyrhizobium sp. Pha-3]|uniref:hypothetical protein n=1 Tax=Bradyrhizobium sp. Pha-3 TaxID=208375 RepID=UPI0035D4D207